MASVAWLAGDALRAALPAPAGWMTFALGVLAVALLLSEHGVTRRRLRPLGVQRQVCSLTMHRRGPSVAAASWGFQLGLGTATRVNTWAAWIFIVATAFLLPSSAALIVGCTTSETQAASARPSNNSWALRI